MGIVGEDPAPAGAVTIGRLVGAYWADDEPRGQPVAAAALSDRLLRLLATLSPGEGDDLHDAADDRLPGR